MNHGRGGYTWNHCRCEICVKANRDYQRKYLRARVAAKLVDGHGKVLKKPKVVRYRHIIRNGNGGIISIQ